MGPSRQRAGRASVLRRAHGDSGRCAERWNAGQRVGEEWKAGPSCRLGREGKGEREVERAVALGWAGLGAGFSFLFSIPFPLFYSISKLLKSI